LSPSLSVNAKDRADTRSLKPTARQRPHMNRDPILMARWTDPKSVPRVCVPLSSARSIASTAARGPGDGLQPSHQNEHSVLGCSSARIDVERAVSYRAIAAALALEELSVGERLAAFSLASYGGRDHRAWPSIRTAAARAGLSRRQYLIARDKLTERRLIVPEPSNGGGARTALIYLGFAEHGETVGREINAELFEAVLSDSEVTGGARVLLATLAALAGANGLVDEVSAEEICEASGLSERTYRRARGDLIGRGALTLEQAGGGRGHRNRWRVNDPREAAETTRQLPRAPRRAAPPRQPPLVAIVKSPSSIDQPAHRHGQHGEAVDAVDASAVSAIPCRNPGVNPGQNRTPRHSKTPARTPAETPAPYVCAGRESQNLETTPPNPPAGGQPVPVEITEQFVTERGRRRTRRIELDLSELSTATAVDREAWQTVRRRLRETVGASTFEIWLAGFELIAVSVRDRALLIAAPGEIHGWAAARYRRLFADLSAKCGREVRPATERELAVQHAIEHQRAGDATRAASSSPNDTDQQEAV
jgi:hypothetical protein